MRGRRVTSIDARSNYDVIVLGGRQAAGVIYETYLVA
jgi:hypothetical protein